MKNRSQKEIEAFACGMMFAAHCWHISTQKDWCIQDVMRHRDKLEFLGWNPAQVMIALNRPELQKKYEPGMRE